MDLADAEREREVYLAMHKFNICPFLAYPEVLIRLPRSNNRHALVLPNYGQSIDRWVMEAPLPKPLPWMCITHLPRRPVYLH